MSIKTDIFKQAYAELGQMERQEILRWIYDFEGTPLKERSKLIRRSDKSKNNNPIVLSQPRLYHN